MSTFIDLVVTGAKKLIDLVPIWLVSSEEERRELEAKAQRLVDGLNPLFDAADKRDAANTKKMDDAIAKADETTKP